MKDKILKLWHKILLLFSYPQRLADAVNRAATPGEMDELLEDEWNT